MVGEGHRTLPVFLLDFLKKMSVNLDFSRYKLYNKFGD